MEEEAVHAPGEVAVEQRLDHRRRLVPHTAQFSESLGLHDVLTVDMGTADGIHHVVGLIVGRRIQPELAHRHIDVFVMFHTVRNHGGCHAFTGELDTVLPRLLSDSHEEHLVDEVVDGSTNIAQRLVSSLHRNAGIDGQQRQQVIAATLAELLQEVAAPVLRATLPRIDVHILDDFVVGALHKLSEPRINLFLHSLLRELVALQALAATCRRIGMSGRSVSQAEDTPLSGGEG